MAKDVSRSLARNLKNKLMPSTSMRHQ